MRQFVFVFASVGLFALLQSCEEEFIPPVVDIDQSIVVEGYIEAGDRPTPPYVILTRSFAFFNELSQEELDNAFVRGAEVTVFDGTNTAVLSELCLDEIPEDFREQAADLLGISLDSIGFNVCVYIDLSGSMTGEEGRSYTLTVKTADETLRATTTIPEAIPLDSLYFLPPPGQPSDTLAQLRVFLNDPPGIPNYYRYFTQDANGAFQRPFPSVVDDLLFDGQRFEFPLAKAETSGGEFDQATYGLFRLEREVSIKWMTIDGPHFDFWNTLEFSRANQGPFSSYTRVDHNIEGGLGIWGGIAARYYDLVVEY